MHERFRLRDVFALRGFIAAAQEHDDHATPHAIDSITRSNVHAHFNHAAAHGLNIAEIPEANRFHAGQDPRLRACIA